MKTWEQILFGIVLIFIGLASSIFGSLTFDIQYGPYDFTQVYEDGSTRTGRFLYHLGIMARCAVVLLYILRRIDWKQGHSYEFFVVVATFLYMLKECFDVIYCNNVTGSIVYECIGLFIVLALGYILTHHNKNKNGTTQKG